MANVTVPLNTPTEQPTRRSVIGTMAASILGGGTAAAAARLAVAGETDPHIEWWRQSIVIRDRINAEDHTDAVCDALGDKMYALDDLIAETPAQTLAGVCAQLSLAHYCAETWEGDRNEPVEMALRNAVATLERLAGGRA